MSFSIILDGEEVPTLRFAATESIYPEVIRGIQTPARAFMALEDSAEQEISESHGSSSTFDQKEILF